MLLSFLLIVCALVLSHVAIFPKTKGTMRPIKITPEQNQRESAKRP